MFTHHRFLHYHRWSSDTSYYMLQASENTHDTFMYCALSTYFDTVCSGQASIIPLSFLFYYPNCLPGLILSTLNLLWLYLWDCNEWLNWLLFSNCELAQGKQHAGILSTNGSNWFVVSFFGTSTHNWQGFLCCLVKGRQGTYITWHCKM
jgi:hypothetical protein